jgi:hypothetical protein
MINKLNNFSSYLNAGHIVIAERNLTKQVSLKLIANLPEIVKNKTNPLC